MGPDSRNISGIYTLPPGVEAVDGELADPTAFNLVLNDFRLDANLVRPVGAGGTGASTLAGFATALGAVTNLNTLTGLLGRSANLSDLANVGTAQTNLGISAFVKTILDDADGSAVLATLGVNALGRSRIAGTISTDFTPGPGFGQGQGLIPATDQTVVILNAGIDNQDGVTIPAWQSGYEGKEITIWHQDPDLSTEVYVYPAVGMSFNNQAVNQRIILYPGHVMRISYRTSTNAQASVQPIALGSTEWTQIAERNRALDTSSTNLSFLTSHGYRYRIEGRFVSRADTSGLVISFNGGASFTIPFGVAGSTYDFRVEYDSRSTLQKVFTQVRQQIAISGWLRLCQPRYFNGLGGARS